MTYTVAYWMGGSEHGEWRRCVPMDRATADKIARRLVRSGYASYIYETAQLDVIGLPDDAPPAWDFVALAWKAGTNLENCGKP